MQQVTCISSADRLRGFEALTTESSIEKKVGPIVPQNAICRILRRCSRLQINVGKKQQVKHYVTRFGDGAVLGRVNGNSKIGLCEVGVQIVIHMHLNKDMFC